MLLPLQGEGCAFRVPGAMPRAECLLALQDVVMFWSVCLLVFQDVSTRGFLCLQDLNNRITMIDD